MTASPRALVALSGGVDSAVAAWLLINQGFTVECLHMSNWDDDDGYCDAATDLQEHLRGINGLYEIEMSANSGPEEI